MGIELTYLISTCTTKVSILLFYRRLGTAVSKQFRYCVYVAIASVVGFCFTYIVLAFAQCRPLNAFWDQGNAFWRLAHPNDWTCVDEASMVVSACAISMAQDFVACLLPMALFVRLKVSRKQKFALIGIFGVGFLYVMIKSSMSGKTNVSPQLVHLCCASIDYDREGLLPNVRPDVGIPRRMGVDRHRVTHGNRLRIIASDEAFLPPGPQGHAGWVCSEIMGEEELPRQRQKQKQEQRKQ